MSETSASVPRLSGDLGLPAGGVAAVLRLLGEGCTVPFVARYRKEATGNLDEVQIRAIQERHAYLAELEDRRATILSSIEEQGNLTDALRSRIEAVETKTELEDLYLPFRPKRRTRATIARERGLEPLARRLLEQPDSGEPLAEAAGFVDADEGVEDAEAALSGARDIAAEVVAERAEVRAMVRRAFAEQGLGAAEVVPEKRGERTKFEQYYAFKESVRDIPSHRYLAVRRGEAEGVLKVRIDVDGDRLVAEIGRIVELRPGTPFAEQLGTAVRDAYRRLIAPSVENDVRSELKQRSDEAAVGVFAENLRNLLLAAPLGGRSVIGIDPGQRTGCKCAAVDATGKFLDHVTIYLTRGSGAGERAERDLLALVRRHEPAAIAVGNGTGGRETFAFVKDLLRREDLSDVIVVLVNESGASVYSASDIAREEFPELDLTVRGAISIGRRLQDPLAELVKVEPKAIGVGQYQHDVHQPLLARKLEEVVESCVNHVGVELNTASAPLLGYVSGIGSVLAKRIVSHRDDHGAFTSRRALLKVKGLGPKTFEQCAGFLRIRDGEHPLDASAVHPERYALVARMAADVGVDLAELVGSKRLVERIDLRRYVGDGVGEPTLRDILAELEKPGRDPRESFQAPKFREDVQTMEDLRTGMSLEGVVTNVTHFGAFVDIGVHQDGLVHISELADHFVRDPGEIVKVGDRIAVRVLDVDLERRRISLSARSGGEKRRGPARPGGGGRGSAGPKTGAGRGAKGKSSRFSHNPFAVLDPKKRKG